MRRGMGVGRRGPGLLGTMARTAVIAGTATATSRAVVGHSERKQQEKMAAEQAAQEQQQQVTTQDAAPPPAAPVDLTGELQKLAALKESGALSDAEFAAAKARLLGG